MNAAELLTLLGQAWARLLLFPAGLTALLLLWLIELRRAPLPSAEPRRPFAETLTAVVAPWLALALLPLPLLANLSRGTDALLLLVLFEWPRWLAAASDIHYGDAAAQQRGVARLAALLNTAPVVIFAVLLLVAVHGTLETRNLLRLPPDAGSIDQLRFWGGAIGLTLALPGMLEVGAFALGRTTDPLLRVGLYLRSFGLLLLTALPWMSLLRDANGPIAWLLPLPPLLLLLLVWGADRAGRSHTALQWARGYSALAALLLIGVLLSAAAALQQRLQ
ncbi:MAG TPA: hypothetical protein PKA05_23230 [Roseiflexaceae bacterium]|nr:hypothetical protein [Roseiflexaceae bacterium]